MLQYKSLPQHIEAVFIQNILKIFAHVMEQYEIDQQYDAIISLCEAVSDKMNESLKSGELEVQERASTTVVILKIVQEEISASKLKIIILNFFYNICFLFFFFRESRNKYQTYGC